jgi:hypothetical protein
MLDHVARISVVRQAAVTAACELCAIQAAELGSVVLVQHSRGGTVRFAVCDRCALALRRVAAAAGGPASFDVAEAPSRADDLATGVVHSPVVAEDVATPELIEVRAERVLGPDGVEYVPQVYGQARLDGTWIGWIEFVSPDGTVSRRTGHETTQSSRDQVAYWASGLEPTYFEGAYSRARTLTASV